MKRLITTTIISIALLICAVASASAAVSRRPGHEISMPPLYINVDAPAKTATLKKVDIRPSQSALITAAGEGLTDTVAQLLDRGAEIDKTSDDYWYDEEWDHRWNALRLAAFYGHEETMQLLLQRGADVNSRDIFGMTALMYAAIKGRVSTVKTLLQQPGISVDINSKEGMTALIYAASFGYTNIVAMLIDRGADVNHANRYGTTALHHAAEGGYEEIVGQLMAQGADLTIQDKKGRTASAFARFNNHTQIAGLLESETDSDL